MSINLEWYNFFYSIVEYNSFSEAAKEMFISQPAITQKIHNLEKQLGIKLFNRMSEGVQLTDEGKKLYDNIKEPIKNLKEIERNIKELRVNKENMIRIGVEDKIFGIDFIYQLLIKFYKSNFNIHVIIKKVNIQDGINELNNEELDILLTNTKNFRRKNITTENKIILHPCFYVSNDFYHKEKINLLCENRFTYILPPENFAERKIFDNLHKKYNIYVHSIYEIEDKQMKEFLIKNNLGISFGFRENIIEELTNGQLKEIKFNMDIPEYELFIIQKKNKTNKIDLDKIIKNK